MSALPTRILWLLRDRPSGAYADEISQHFAAYHVGTLCAALRTLLAHRLIEQQATASPYVLTPTGRTAATSSNPPRWSPRRHSPPHTATIAR